MTDALRYCAGFVLAVWATAVTMTALWWRDR